MAKKKVKRVRPRRQKRSALGYSVIMTLVVVLGIAGIALSRGDRNPGSGGVGPAIGDHWHAALGVNVCGQWKPNTPQYESGSGIHSHGDGFIHIHPFGRAGAGKNASVGLFLEGAGEKAPRPRPLTSAPPKPLLPTANRPFLERQLAWLAAAGVDEVILSLGYR